jgi:predicted secreted hydrolase
MKTIFCFSVMAFLLSFAQAENPWRLALPGWQYIFQRDHAVHSDFKTEWWYFTGNLAAPNGRRFGYQLTFFRQGIRSPSKRVDTTSRFIVGDLHFAHFAISDADGRRFQFFQKTSRGSFAEAGFGPIRRDGSADLAWIDDWSLKQSADSQWKISARAQGVSLDLDLEAAKPWVIHGKEGISQKAEGEGRASHYYSGTRLRSRGRIMLDKEAWEVSGASWFDHEWGSNQLTPEQIGWNWFSIHFGDGTELMLYQMRLRGDEIDPNSSGTFVAADGLSQHLPRDDYSLKPIRWWKSRATSGRYPIAWEISVPKLGLKAEVKTPIEQQELVLMPIAYWEGMIEVEAQRNGQRLLGEGYMELTGYAGELVGLSQRTGSP